LVRTHVHAFTANIRPDGDALIGGGVAIGGAWGAGVGLDAARAAPGSGPLDAEAKAKKIAFDRVGGGETILFISGCPSTRRSWNQLIPLLSGRYQCVPTDLPSFGDLGCCKRTLAAARTQVNA
jgi:pimeloyl-ACP methyl ester carboxylesterase